GNTGTVNNNAGATWTGAATNNAGGTVNNAGLWTTLAGGFLNSGTLNTTGTLNATTGGLTNTSTGTVNAQGNIRGTIDNNAGGIFNLTGSLTLGSTFNNAGTLNANLIGGARGAPPPDPTRRVPVQKSATVAAA